MNRYALYPIDMRTTFLIFLSLSTSQALAAARLVETSGPVIALYEGKPIELKPGALIPDGTEVKSGEKGFSKIQLPDHSLFVVGPSTTLKISESTLESVEASIDVGKVRAVVSKQKDRKKFMIKTQSVVMGVRGTEFLVQVTPLPSGGVRTDTFCLSGLIAVQDMHGKDLPMLKQGIALSVANTSLQRQIIPQSAMKSLGSDQFMRGTAPPTSLGAPNFNPPAPEIQNGPHRPIPAGNLPQKPGSAPLGEQQLPVQGLAPIRPNPSLGTKITPLPGSPSLPPPSGNLPPAGSTPPLNGNQYTPPYTPPPY